MLFVLAGILGFITIAGLGFAFMRRRQRVEQGR